MLACTLCGAAELVKVALVAPNLSCCCWYAPCTIATDPPTPMHTTLQTLKQTKQTMRPWKCCRSWSEFQPLHHPLSCPTYSLIANNSVFARPASALFYNNDTAGAALAGGQWLMPNASTTYGAVVLALQYSRYDSHCRSGRHTIGGKRGGT